MIFELSNDITRALVDARRHGLARLLPWIPGTTRKRPGRCYFCKRALNRLAMRAS